MSYAVTVAGHTFVIEVAGGHVVVDGRRLAFDFQAVPGTPLHRLALDGSTRTVAVQRSEGGWVVTNGGAVRSVEVMDERVRRLRAAVGGGGGSTGEVVRAPMPGLVLRLEVAAGDLVRRGTGVAVLEAMKMENEIRSSVEGRVERILVEPGAAVEKGEALVEIGPAS